MDGSDYFDIAARAQTTAAVLQRWVHAALSYHDPQRSFCDEMQMSYDNWHKT